MSEQSADFYDDDEEVLHDRMRAHRKDDPLRVLTRGAENDDDGPQLYDAPMSYCFADEPDEVDEEDDDGDEILLSWR